ncbi:MAG: hypothetical protein LBM62_09430 [Mediterranea sp.]|jgi:hypothetical protein|nr:hypothetical protein [Mediterranea sp.]
MKDATRKVNFFHLLFQGDETSSVVDKTQKLLKFINSKSKTAKKQDLPDDKFCFLDSHNYNDDGNIVKVLFKSAKHSYRAPLLNRKTVEERENPKMMDEGEQVKTHLLIKFINGDAVTFVEYFKGALSMKCIVDYFNHFVQRYNAEHKRDKFIGKFAFDIIPRDDFREVLDNMDRAVQANVYIEKSILGSDALNFSERVQSVKKDIVIEIKSKRGESIKDAIYDFLAKLNGGQRNIQKIRVRGVMPNKTESIIDTAFIIKREYVAAQQNEDTGEINTPYLFSQLEDLSNDFQ